MGWIDSILYLILISAIAFPVGRMLPKQWFHYDQFPFSAAEWEENGKFYYRLGIRKWQHKLLDMSRIMPKIMKRKELPADCSAEDVRYLLDETCIAEVVHAALCILGIFCMYLWKGIGGIVFFLLYIIFCQLPYIVIQRYNRPKLARLYQRMTQERNLEK